MEPTFNEAEQFWIHTLPSDTSHYQYGVRGRRQWAQGIVPIPSAYRTHNEPWAPAPQAMNEVIMNAVLGTYSGLPEELRPNPQQFENVHMSGRHLLAQARNMQTLPMSKDILARAPEHLKPEALALQHFETYSLSERQKQKHQSTLPDKLPTAYQSIVGRSPWQSMTPKELKRQRDEEIFVFPEGEGQDQKWSDLPYGVTTMSKKFKRVYEKKQKQRAPFFS